MTIVTRNSTYTFVDRGDGAFYCTSTNERYSGMMVSLPYPPVIGQPFYVRRETGPKAGIPFVTSIVVKVEVSE